jgi:hypothetical protein
LSIPLTFIPLTIPAFSLPQSPSFALIAAHRITSALVMLPFKFERIAFDPAAL